MEQKGRIEAAELQKQQDKDYIQLTDVQKIRELAPQDRYNVLEFLVKELIQLKALDLNGEGKRKHKKRKRRHHSSSDSDSSSSDSEAEDSEESHKRKKKTRKSKHSSRKRKSKASDHKDAKKGVKAAAKQGKTIDVVNTEADLEEEGKLESISVDDDNKIIQSSRKEWEEELTSTQNMGISVSMRKRDAEVRNSQQRKNFVVEPTIKLQNFVASDAKGAAGSNSNSNPNSRFSSHLEEAKKGGARQRKVSDMSNMVRTNEDESENYEYDDDFESLSKSQAQVSMSLNVKKSLNKNKQGNRLDYEESYSNEFESFADSKSMSTEATVICFMCKQ